jgi:hypothetical protein
MDNLLLFLAFKADLQVFCLGLNKVLHYRHLLDDYTSMNSIKAVTFYFGEYNSNKYSYIVHLFFISTFIQYIVVYIYNKTSKCGCNAKAYSMAADLVRDVF